MENKKAVKQTTSHNKDECHKHKVEKKEPTKYFMLQNIIYVNFKKVKTILVEKRKAGM